MNSKLIGLRFTFYYLIRIPEIPAVQEARPSASASPERTTVTESTLMSLCKKLFWGSRRSERSSGGRLGGSEAEVSTSRSSRSGRKAAILLKLGDRSFRLKTKRAYLHVTSEPARREEEADI